MEPSPSKTKPTYRLVLEAQPNAIEEVVRLRSLLKTALRRFGFKCVRVERITPAAEQTNAKTPA